MKRETGPTLDFTETNIELTMLEKWDFLFKITAGNENSSAVTAVLLRITGSIETLHFSCSGS